MFKYHILALLLGTILDFVFGKIYSIWNPFDSIRGFVKYLDRALLGDEIILLEPSKQKSLGIWLIAIVILPVFAVITFFTMLCYDIAIPVGVLFEAFATYLCVDCKYLLTGAISVMNEFYSDGIDAMKNAYQLIFSKESMENDEAKVTEEVITYVANEASDAVISPLVVMFLFGPVGGFIYRTIDIIDGEIGYRNSRYNHFGCPAATLFRIVDYIPGKVSGALSVFCARHITCDLDGRNGKYINLRDRYKAVSAFAGALQIQLKEGTVGDADRIPKASDIRRAVRLTRHVFILIQVILVILLLIF